MYRIKKGSSVKLPVALMALLVVGWILVQQVTVTRSEAQIRPGVKKVLLPPKLMAPPAAPPDVLEEEQLRSQGPAPGQRQRPTLKTLLEKIRQRPGGQDILDEAKRRGARIGMNTDDSGSSLSWLNPFRLRNAEAQGTVSATHDPSNDWSGGYGGVYFYSAVTGRYYSTQSYAWLYPKSVSSYGHKLTNPYAYLYINVPSDGWYIVNVEAYNGGPVTLMHSSSTVDTWDHTGDTDTHSFPAVVELSAGNHYFYYMFETSTKVYEVNLYGL